MIHSLLLTCHITRNDPLPTTDICHITRNDPLSITHIYHITRNDDKSYTVTFIFLRECSLQRKESEALPIKPGRNKGHNFGPGCAVSKTPCTLILGKRNYSAK